MKHNTAMLAVVAAFSIVHVALATPMPAPHLVTIATYDTGLGSNGSEIISIRHSDLTAAVTNVVGSIEVLSLANPTQPTLLRRVDLDTTTGTPNSVAVHPQHDYFLVTLGKSGVVGSVAAYRLSDGAFLAAVPVGIQPDSIAIAPNGQYAVVANEAEGVDIGQNGGDGSLSVIDLQGFNSAAPSDLSVIHIPLPSLANLPGFSTQRTDDIARLPIDNTPGTLEPELVAFTENSRFAYITLQENNGVARLDLHNLELAFFGLNQTQHAADLTVDGLYQPIPNALLSYREPDGIALSRNGKIFVTADEGDTRNAARASGTRGGRTVSVFDAASGAFLGDTGSQLDDAAAAAAGVYPDSRSNRGGSEPEGIDLTDYQGRSLVAVGLERANAVALVDVSNPKAPQVIDLTAVGSAPEGVKFFRQGPRLFIASANEGSGTVSILEVSP